MNKITLITIITIFNIASAQAADNKQLTQLSMTKLNQEFVNTSGMPNPKREKNGDLKIYCTNIVFYTWAKFYLNILGKTPITIDDIGAELAEKFAKNYFRFEYKTKQMEFFRPGATTTIYDAINSKIFEYNNNKSLAEDQFRFDEIQETLYVKSLQTCISDDLYQNLKLPKAPDPTSRLPGYLYIPEFSVGWHATKDGGLEPIQKTEASLEFKRNKKMNYNDFIETLRN